MRTLRSRLGGRLRRWWRPAAEAVVSGRWHELGGTGPVADERDLYHCYRLLLGREPDANGWMHYRYQVAGGQVWHQDLVRSFLYSDEFRRRELITPPQRMQHTVVDLGDFKMYASPEDPAVGQEIAGARTYEPHVTRVLQRFLKPGGVFIDIGANIGYFSLMAASRLGPSGRVFSFEPNAYSYTLLLWSCQLNGFSNVEVYPFALADRRGFFIYNAAGSNGVISDREEDLSSALSHGLAYANTLDATLTDLERVDVLKIDVEGAEYLALQGAREMLTRCHPVVFSEFAPEPLQLVSHVDGGRYLSFLIDSGYELSVIPLDGDLVPCGRDPERVLLAIDRALHHVDILAVPEVTVS